MAKNYSCIAVDTSFC